ncbi:hypothetical protein [Pontimicrobium aquaticum]|uniref:YD repeat-containing protein n=1 Tax=Pontimicrobium aquaticum TaxID=2565367 RepID=A0A4U0EJF9_9FLAO|nr:hypothetical protein [Pontimicrobium aquaticum]TJY31583.1 hypothetical protein E5167_15165 [Pontimicrobium aquaticum]
MSLNLFGQKPTEKVGEIEVKLIGHNFKRNSDYELTKKKTNRKNRPYLRMYFNSNGTLLKSIGFGKHHNTDLRLIDRINIYKYDRNGLKSKIDIWETDYDKDLSFTYYKIFDLDSTQTNILSEKMYEVESDTIYTQTDYWYNEKSEYQGIIFDSTYYYKRKYNEKKQLINLQQIYDGKLRWEWNYSYYDSKRIGIFQTFYNDGKDYSKKEIKTYDKLGRLIEIEELQITKNGMKEKTKIYYGKNGVIDRIEEYDSYNREDGYEFVSYQEVKVKSKVIVDSQIAERINEQIITE